MIHTLCNMVIKKSHCRLRQLQQCSAKSGLWILIATVGGKVSGGCSSCLLSVLRVLPLLDIFTSVAWWNGRRKEGKKRDHTVFISPCSLSQHPVYEFCPSPVW